MKPLSVYKAIQALKDNKKVQYKLPDSNCWETLRNTYSINVLLYKDIKFRLAQETITIGDVSFPKPIDFKPSSHTRYYIPSPICDRLFEWYVWADDFADNRLLQRGLVHLTQEDAITHARAIIQLSGGSYEKN